MGDGGTFRDGNDRINAVGLLDNCQVRYFTGIEPQHQVTETDAAKAIAASGRVDRIGLTEAMPDFLAGVAQDMGWAPPDRLPRENVTRRFYGLDVTRRRIRSVLEPLVRHDLALYTHLKERDD